MAVTTRVEEWVKVGTQLIRRGRTARTVNARPPAPVFVLGETEASPDNTGGGTYVESDGSQRAAPTIVVNTDITVGPGQVYEDRIINGRLLVDGSATPGRARNCIVRGSATPPTSGSTLNLVSIINLPATLVEGAPQAILENVTIDPQVASNWWAGIGNKNYKTIRCLIRNVVDGYSIFSSTADGIVNVSDEGSYVGELTRFAPDVAYNNTTPRDETHDDCIQNQGSKDNPIFTGTTLNARQSQTKSSPLPPVRSNLAAVMLNANTQTRAGIILRKAVLKGGIFCVNVGIASGYVEMTDCKVERPGSAADGYAPNVAISIRSTVTQLIQRVFYIDQPTTPVPVTNG